MEQLGQPICNNCGYNLEGAVTSASCPECGRPLIEVLQRVPSENTRYYKRYTSKRAFFGLPLVDIAQGAGPGEKVGKAVGVIAIGDHATGFIAIGGFARGGIAIGGISFGLVSMGGLSVGLLAANGGMALAGLAAFGGVAFSGYLAMGGMAAGHVGTAGLWMQLW